MKVWVVISGVPYESREVIEGVYTSEEKAKEKINSLEDSPALYKYIEEHEIE